MAVFALLAGTTTLVFLGIILAISSAFFSLVSQHMQSQLNNMLEKESIINPFLESYIIPPENTRKIKGILVFCRGYKVRTLARNGVIY